MNKRRRDKLQDNVIKVVKDDDSDDPVYQLYVSQIVQINSEVPNKGLENLLVLFG